MSHDGNKNYHERLYQEEKLIRINGYVDIENKIEYSFIQASI